MRELQDLTAALRALAASHVQEAQGALAGIRRYTAAIESAIARGAALLPETGGRRLPQEPTGRGVLIVACSEHGFVGAFNEHILDRAEAAREAGLELAVVGRRGAMLADERGLDVRWRFPMATHVGGVLGVARRVADRLATTTTAGAVFGRYKRGGESAVEEMSILPLDPALLIAAQARSPPLHHLATEELLERLAEEYLVARITRAVMESLASENGARLRMMETADRNIDHKLDALGRREQSLRQEAVTAELVDVVTGAEAVLGGEDR